MLTNPRPTYRAENETVPNGHTRKVRENRFSVFELRGTQETQLFSIHRDEFLNQCMLRGIPVDDATNLAEQIKSM